MDKNGTTIKELTDKYIKDMRGQGVTDYSIIFNNPETKTDTLYGGGSPFWRTGAAAHLFAGELLQGLLDNHKLFNVNLGKEADDAKD